MFDDWDDYDNYPPELEILDDEEHWTLDDEEPCDDPDCDICNLLQ